MQVFWTYVLAKKSIMNICMLYLNTKTYKPFAWSRKKEHMYLCMYTHHICSYIDLHSKVVACDRCDVRTSVWLSRIISTRALASSSTAQRRRWMNVCVCVCLRVWCGSREATEIAWVRIVIHARRVLAQKPSIYGPNSRSHEPTTLLLSLGLYFCFVVILRIIFTIVDRSLSSLFGYNAKHQIFNKKPKKKWIHLWAAELCCLDNR